MYPTIKWKLVFAVSDMVDESRLQGIVVAMTMHVPNNQMEFSVCQESWSQLRRQERMRRTPNYQMAVGVCCEVDMVEEARLQGSAVMKNVPNNQIEVCVCFQIDMGEEASCSRG